MRRDQLIKLLELIGSNHDGEALNAARKAHELVRVNGTTWDDYIIKNVKEDDELRSILLEVHHRLHRLGNSDQKSFLEVRERFFEGTLSETDVRRVTFYRDLIATIPDDIPF